MVSPPWAAHLLLDQSCYLATFDSKYKILYTAPCPRNPSYGPEPRSMTSGRFRKMRDALRDNAFVLYSKDWNPSIGSRCQVLAKGYMKYGFTRKSSTVFFISQSSAKESTCFMRFRSAHRNLENRHRLGETASCAIDQRAQGSMKTGGKAGSS